MRFQLNVYGSPWSSNAALDAQCFCESLLVNQDDIARVFFFFDGIYNGIASQSPAADEAQILQNWRNIHQRGVSLFLCIAASANRGVLNAEEAQRYDQSVTSVDPSFEVTGLGQWARGFHDVDRMVSFR